MNKKTMKLLYWQSVKRWACKISNERGMSPFILPNIYNSGISVGLKGKSWKMELFNYEDEEFTESKKQKLEWEVKHNNWLVIPYEPIDRFKETFPTEKEIYKEHYTEEKYILYMVEEAINTQEKALKNSYFFRKRMRDKERKLKLFEPILKDLGIIDYDTTFYSDIIEEIQWKTDFIEYIVDKDIKTLLEEGKKAAEVIELLVEKYGNNVPE